MRLQIPLPVGIPLVSVGLPGTSPSKEGGEEKGEGGEKKREGAGLLVMLRMCLDDRQWGVVVESVRCFHSVLFCGVTEGIAGEV